MPAHPDLIKHSEVFRKNTVEVAPGVYSAVGYAASNVHMIVGDEGLIIIDTTESTGAAENILAEFRKISDLPIQCIIYTHAHRDHISGARVFAENETVEIIASHLFKSDLVDIDTDLPSPDKALHARTKRQFGIGLSFPDERVNLGLGPGDRPMKGLGEGFVPPTNLITENRVSITRCGVDLELIHAPGETLDHVVVWLPDRRVLFSGDNYYHSFPNLYAIRGTPYRDFNAWVQTLDLLMGFDADVLAPGHSQPLIGKEIIREHLQDYRDAIFHIISESSDAMNAGFGWDAVAEQVQLPERLRDKPHLKEFYGKVSWAVRAYCTGTLGWFDGNPTNLNRLSPSEEANRMVSLAGGFEAVVLAAQSAFEKEDYQWTLELADRLLVLDANNPSATKLKIDAMRALADLEINATARNTYLMRAKEMEE